MSDRWVFLIAFLTVIVIVAGAFAMPHYFTFELLKSLIFLAIALMVFFGEDRFSYMLGMIAPILGFVLNILLGGFFGEFKGLFNALTGKASPPHEHASPRLINPAGDCAYHCLLSRLAQTGHREVLRKDVLDLPGDIDWLRRDSGGLAFHSCSLSVRLP